MNTEAQIIPANLSEIKPFSQFESQLATMKAENEKAVFDYASPKGAKEARSHIFGIRKVRAALELARKDAKAAALEYGRTLDAEAKRIESELNAMISVHETPLLEIEAKEAALVKAIQDRVATLEAYKLIPASADSKAWGIELDRVNAFVIDPTLAEFMAPAAIAKDVAINAIRERFQALVKQEEDAAELAKLKAEQAERERIEREEKIRTEAAEKAKKDAEEKAERARMAAEQEQRRKDEAAAAEAKRQQEATERAQREAKEAVERAERAEREAKAKAEKDLADKLEAERLAAERRESNKRHLATINNAAAQALMGKVEGLTEEMAKAVVIAIAKKEIPAIAITY